MKRFQIAAIAIVTLAWVALFAWGVTAGAEEVMGIVAAEGDVAIAASDQPGATDEVVIDEVVAPEDAWVVVHQSNDGMPGMRLGLARVEAGTSTDVEVELMTEDAELTPKLLVAVHADRGTANEFEFDMENMEHSFDRPFFVDGMEAATEFAVE